VVGEREHLADSSQPVLVPPRPLPQPAFAQVTIPTTSGPPQHLYHVPDDEIDFATYLKQPLPPGIASSAGVKWKAHWLAVEGIQPAIPENPTPSSRAGRASTPRFQSIQHIANEDRSASRIQPVPTTGPASLRPSAKSHLPQELQLYFTRLTSALIPPSTALPILPGQPTDDGSLPDAERHRLAALASVRSDQAMGGVLVYFVKWLAESISKCLMSATGVLGCLVDGVEALLANESIFLEPYVRPLAPFSHNSFAILVTLCPVVPKANQY
jgi:transcription initiation factor TFIID subunit 6